MSSIDVFVDWSRVADTAALPAALTRLENEEHLGAIGRHIFCAVPASFTAPLGLERAANSRVFAGRPVRACAIAMAAAADAGRPLLVLLGRVEPRTDAVGVMLEALRGDPMLGFAAARLSGARDDSLAALDRGGDRAIAELPRRVLAEIPDTYLVADAPARCLLIGPHILTNFEAVDERFRTVAGALWHYISRARRCGFRTVVCNRAVVGTAGATTPCVVTPESLPRADRALLRDVSPDAERAHQEFGTRLGAPTESRLARALPEAYGDRPSLLLDVRNIGRAMNGTATAALGIASGLHALAAGWDVVLLARPEASSIHQLPRCFPGWRISTSLPDRQFSAAVRLSQPWHVEEMIELHSLAAVNVYLFLDTISWDVTYPAPRHLDGTWRFMADHADGLLFISEFTRARFNRRFAPRADLATAVSYLSFAAADYVRADVVPAARRDGPLFVMGNAYDHKDVAGTIDILAGAFPYQPIVALGPVAAPARVTVLESGELSDLELHKLYASARAVIFPSFYEGFGFPIVTALAYGRTVLARRSTLLEEIAGQSAARGRLVPYERRDDLVELVGRLLHGQDLPQLPLGTWLAGGRPKSWRDVAADVLTFISDRVADLSRSRWRERDHTIRQLLAFRGEPIEAGAR